MQINEERATNTPPVEVHADVVQKDNYEHDMEHNVVSNMRNGSL